MRSLGFLLLATVFLSGCDSVPSFIAEKQGCSNETGQQAAISIIKDAVLKELSEYTDDYDNRLIPASKARAALDQIEFLFEDIRTTKKDPNSTQNFCSGVLKVTLPAEMIKGADRANELAAGQSLSEIASRFDIKQQGTSFLVDMKFAIQPTDDKQKVYATIEDYTASSNLVEHALVGHLLRKQIEQKQQEERQAAQAEERAEQDALTQQRQANLEQAKAENQLTEQTINAIWRAVPQEYRDQLLPVQRAWIKKKTADCRIEAASASTDPSEREAANLQCQARMNNERSQELRRFTDYSEE